MERIKILGIPVDVVSKASVLAMIDEYIGERTPRFLSFINPEIIMKCRKVLDLKQAIEDADLIAPDGVGILLAARIAGYKLHGRVTGTDIMYEIARLSALKGYSIYLFGAKPGVPEKAACVLRKKYPGVKIVGARHGYFERDEDVLCQIEQAKPDILIVCLGMVKQELWIRKYFDRLKVPVSFGNGGALDFVSGKVKRAPLWMQKAGLEWLHRLSQDFTYYRIRRCCTVVEFLFLVLFYRILKRRIN